MRYFLFSLKTESKWASNKLVVGENSDKPEVVLYSDDGDIRWCGVEISGQKMTLILSFVEISVTGTLTKLIYCPFSLQIYVGGVIEKDSPHLPGKVNFRGCLENVFVNGINIIYKTQYQDPDVRFAPKKVAFYSNQLPQGR